MSDEADLIARLRAYNHVTGAPFPAMAKESADTIERLVRERAHAAKNEAHLANISGALVDAGMSVGDVSGFADLVRKLAAERDEWNDVAGKEYAHADILRINHDVLATQVEELRGELRNIVGSGCNRHKINNLLARTTTPALPEGFRFVPTEEVKVGEMSGLRIESPNTREVAREWPDAEWMKFPDGSRVIAWKNADGSVSDVGLLPAGGELVTLDSQRAPLLAQIAEMTGRYETSHASRLHAEKCLDAALAQIARLEALDEQNDIDLAAYEDKLAKIAMLRGEGWELINALTHVEIMDKKDHAPGERLGRAENAMRRALTETADAQAWLEGKLAEERERMLERVELAVMDGARRHFGQHAGTLDGIRMVFASIRALGPRTGDGT